MRSTLRKSLQLYLFFFRIGWYTFGGGWSIVAQMEEEYVSRRGDLTSGDLLDIVSVGRSLPGTMVGNVAYLLGYHLAGFPGGVLSVLGIITPPLIILSVLTVLYEQYHDSYYVAKALTGVRAVVVPIIFSAVLKLHQSAFPHRICYLVCLAACALSVFLDLSCTWIVLLALVFGLVFAPENGTEGS